MQMTSSFTVRALAGLRPSLVLALGCFAALAPRVAAEEGARAPAAMPLPQEWTARIVVPEGVDPGIAADRIVFKIFQTSSDEEVQDLARELKRGGQEGLRNAMFQLKAKGWIQIGRRAATEVTVIRVGDTGDGLRTVRLYSDRPLRLYDRSDPPGSTAHPFAFLELRADSSGTGEGLLIAAASLAMGEEGLKIESAGTPVIRIAEVTTDSPPPPPARP